MVTLTLKGEWLASKLIPIFDLLYELNHFQTNINSRVRIAVTPSFSLSFLTYQVGKFSHLFPDIDIEIVIAGTPLEPCDELADIFITTENDFQGYYSEYLFSESLIPVASQGVVEKGAILSAGDLTGYTLLVNCEHMGSDWQKWFAYHQLKPATYQKVSQFSHTLLVREAVERGCGIALACEMTLGQDIELERLQTVGLASFPSGRHFYLICKNRLRHQGNIKCVYDWLCHQFVVSE